MVRNQSSGNIRLAARAASGSGGGSSVRDPNKQTTVHEVFHGCVQALMYVLCYHMDHMLGMPHMAAKVQALVVEGLMPLLRHASRPLDMCNAAVNEEFRSQLASRGMTDFPAYIPRVQVCTGLLSCIVDRADASCTTVQWVICRRYGATAIMVN
jgi:hypothetical protein